MGVRGVSDAQKEYQFFVNVNEDLYKVCKIRYRSVFWGNFVDFNLLVIVDRNGNGDIIFFFLFGLKGSL